MTRRGGMAGWRRSFQILSVAVLLVVPEVAAAQDSAPFQYRKWVLGVAGAVALGVPTFISGDFTDELGPCTRQACFAPLATIVGFSVGFLIGHERDQKADRIFMPGPTRMLDTRRLELPMLPEHIVPGGERSLIVGSGGMMQLSSDLSMMTIPGIRGLTGATALPEHDVIFGSTSEALFAFAISGRVRSGRRVYAVGGSSLLGVGDQVFLGGGSSLRRLSVEGEGLRVTIREEARILDQVAPAALAGDESGQVIWVVAGNRLTARSADTLEPIGFLDLPGPGRTLDIRGGLGAITAQQDGVYILDLSQPATPILLSHYRGVRQAHGAAFFGAELFVAAGEQGLVILDLATPSNPEVSGVVRNLGRPLSVVRGSGSLLVFDRGERDLHIISERSAFPPSN